MLLAVENSLFARLLVKSSYFRSSSSASTASRSASASGGKFKPLDLGRGRLVLTGRRDHGRQRRPGVTYRPRAERQSVDQHWPSVWPAPRSFAAGTVPLPLRQGYVKKIGQTPPQAAANAELMKLANFLHLTPPAIKLHCQALKRFCTPWPDTIREDQALDRCLPMQVTTTDYVFASPEIGHDDARIVRVKLPMSVLALGAKRDAPVRDKFLRLAWQWYNGDDDTVCVEADRCPRRRQNYRHALYQLAVCRMESLRQDRWETTTRQRSDHQCFLWDGSTSQRVSRTLWRTRADKNAGDMLRSVQGLLDCIESVMDERVPSEGTTDEYSRAVCRLYGMPEPPIPHALCS